jgi:hypothetical protein
LSHSFQKTPKNPSYLKFPLNHLFPMNHLFLKFHYHLHLRQFDLPIEYYNQYYLFLLKLDQKFLLLERQRHLSHLFLKILNYLKFLTNRLIHLYLKIPSFLKFQPNRLNHSFQKNPRFPKNHSTH